MRGIRYESTYNKEKGIYTDGEVSQHSSLHANMFPLAFDIVPIEFKNSVVEFEKQTQDNGNGDSTTVLATFFEAINNKKNINLKLKANENDWHHFSPMMVKISGKDISFIVRKNGDMEKQTISLDTIADIKIEEEYVPVK